MALADEILKKISDFECGFALAKIICVCVTKTAIGMKMHSERMMRHGCLRDSPNSFIFAIIFCIIFINQKYA
jgi:hypothetical protein